MMRSRGNSFLATSDSLGEQRRESILKTVGIPLGSLLVAALGYIGRDAPIWATTIITAYIGLVAIGIILPYVQDCGEGIKKCVLRVAIKVRYLSKLRQMVNLFFPLFDESRPETILQAWKTIGSWEEAKKYVVADELHFRTLNRWLYSINSRLISKGNACFSEIANEFGQLISQYQYLCEKAYRELDALSTSGDLPAQKLRQLKQDWNLIRDKHNQTIRTWEDIAKNINIAADDRICIDSYSQLKTIE